MKALKLKKLMHKQSQIIFVGYSTDAGVGTGGFGGH